MNFKASLDQYLRLDTINNPDLKRKANILGRLIVSMFFILLITFTLSSLLTQVFHWRHMLIMVILFLASAACLLSLRKGYIRPTAVAYISFLMAMIFIFSWSAGGIRGHGIKILPIIVLFSGLTLGKREIWYFGIAASLGGLFFVMADYWQWMPKSEPIGHSVVVYWLYSSAGIMSLCFLENISVGLLQTVLNQREEELSLRVQSEEKLRLNHLQLAEILRFQSHDVRKSLANVLGILEMIDYSDCGNESNQELMKHLGKAANELDVALHQLTKESNQILQAGDQK